MRILLIGNYAPDRQESMLRYASCMERELEARGYAVRMLQPQRVFARQKPSGMNKWLGYLDKFVVFPFVLKKALGDFDVVHILDHSNAIYTRYLTGKPHVCTCHDVLAITSALGEVPQNVVSSTGRQLQKLILNGLKAAQFITCISTNSRLEMLRVTGRPPETSSVVHLSLAFPYTPMPEAEALALLQKFGFDASTPFFIHVGSDAWYKNRLGLVKIFESLQRLNPAAGWRLLMIGSPLEREVADYIASNDLAKSVVWLSGLSNEDLRAAYSLATALIFPSLSEGFGWPVTEAQACGCAVFASNRNPMMEIGGDAAVYFDPTDPESAAAIIAGALPNRDAMCREGLENVQRFSAENMINGYLQAYHHVTASSQYN